MTKKAIIHNMAAAGGATAGLLPVGVDVIALSTEEIVMVCKLGKLWGLTVTEEAATGILTAAGCSVVGSFIFEVANVGYPATIPVKVALAASVIEAAGQLVWRYFSKHYGPCPAV